MVWWRFKNWARFHLPGRVAELVSPLYRGRVRAWKERLARPAALLVKDENPGKLDGNWIGAVRLGLRGEEWPRGKDGRPMTPVVQMNVAESPFVPAPLKGVRVLTMYVSAPDDDYDTIYLPRWDQEEPPHGDGWCVRTYRAGDDLVEITPPTGTRLPRPLAMRWERLDNDVPNFITEICNATHPTRCAWDHKWHREETKLGGWPTFIQGAWHWRPWSNEPDVPLYVFQVRGGDGFDWCDAGAAAIGIDDEGRWVITWSCY